MAMLIVTTDGVAGYEVRSVLGSVFARFLTQASLDGWESTARFPFLNVGTEGVYNITAGEGVFAGRQQNELRRRLSLVAPDVNLTLNLGRCRSSRQAAEL